MQEKKKAEEGETTKPMDSPPPCYKSYSPSSSKKNLSSRRSPSPRQSVKKTENPKSSSPQRNMPKRNQLTPTKIPPSDFALTIVAFSVYIMREGRKSLNKLSLPRSHTALGGSKDSDRGSPAYATRAMLCSTVDANNISRSCQNLFSLTRGILQTRPRIHCSESWPESSRLLHIF
ncbi:hypothetical protein RRG08_027386 [Elysia crispata]|uniref:Uncharacterized protein n=1 Tax=Elysia crispata TaxID=231223 RepID=A0AAE1D1C4_9GAST|nr:hypothetical protein RRG08_027386 [Elysia crispata]